MRGKNIPENLKFGKLLTKILQKEYPFISNVNVDLIDYKFKHSPTLTIALVIDRDWWVENLDIKCYDETLHDDTWYMSCWSFNKCSGDKINEKTIKDTILSVFQLTIGFDVVYNSSIYLSVECNNYKSWLNTNL